MRKIRFAYEARRYEGRLARAIEGRGATPRLGSLDRYTGFFNTHEDEKGRPLDFEGRLDMPNGDQIELTAVRDRLQYAPGTKNVVGGTFAV